MCLNKAFRSFIFVSGSEQLSDFLLVREFDVFLILYHAGPSSVVSFAKAFSLTSFEVKIRLLGFLIFRKEKRRETFLIYLQSFQNAALPNLPPYLITHWCLPHLEDASNSPAIRWYIDLETNLISQWYVDLETRLHWQQTIGQLRFPARRPIY